MQRFESARQAQRFLSIHSWIHNYFQLHRHRLTASDHRSCRTEAFHVWHDVTGTAMAA
jgi:putative transposase